MVEIEPLNEQTMAAAFTNMFKANVSLMQIVSHEWERVFGEVYKSIRKANQQRRYLRWTYADGMMVFDSDSGTWIKGAEDISEIIQDDDLAERANSTPLQLLQWYVGGESTTFDSNGYQHPSILHLEDFHPFIREEPNPHPNRDEIVWWLRQAARMDNASQDIRERTVILGTTSPYHPQELEKELPTIDLDNPTIKTLGAVFNQTVKKFKLSGNQYENSDRILQAALGLSVMEAELAFSSAIAETGQLTEDEIPLINSSKKQIIDRNGILEYFEPGESEKVCGLDDMEEWFRKRRSLFDANVATKLAYDAPKGALLLGIPGCGKSLTAKEVSRWWGFPLLRFDIGKAFGSLQGESERNIRSALKVAETVSPCILWIDEIEKSIQGSESSGQTDGGTSARVFGHFLTWMQEKTDPVFVLATANKVSMLPPEMLRKGRFDEIFFVDLPTKDARETIFDENIRKRAAKNPSFNIENFDIAELANLTNGFSGAEIYQIVKDATLEVIDSDGEPAGDITQQHMLKLIQSTVPLSRTMPDQIKDLRTFGRTRCRLATSSKPEDLPKEWETKKIAKLKTETKSIFLADDDDD